MIDLDTLRDITVPSVGPKDCRICFIGEAPGHDEEIAHEPFVGMSGNILNVKLHASGILRHQCYIDNVIQIRPATFYKYQEALDYCKIRKPKNENDFSIFWNGTKPTDALLDAKASLLKRLENVKANIFVPLGNTALWALTGESKISILRGSILPCTLPSGRIIKIIASYHPAAVIRDWKLGTILQCDLNKAKIQSEFPEIKYPQRELQIAPTFSDIIELTDCGNEYYKILSFDIETSPSDITCIAISTSPGWAMSIPTTKHYWGNISKLHKVLRMVNYLLTRNVPKVGQNISYDLQYLFRIWGILPTKPWHDTMIAQHSAYPDLSGEQKEEGSSKAKRVMKTKSLAFISSIYTDEPYYKDALKKWMDGKSNDEALWRYNARDAAVTLECHYALQNEMHELGVTHTYKFMMELLEPLLYMMLRGVRINEDARMTHIINMTNTLNLNKTVFTAKYGEINLRSPKQVLELIHKLGLKPPIKDGKPSTNKQALDKLAIKSPEFKNIIRFREASTLLNNHLKAPGDGEDGRWRCSFNSTGAATGRLSSSEGIFGSATNLQNVKNSLRNIVIPDPGMIFTEADLKGAEAMVVAYLCEDEILINKFINGDNIHTFTATDIIWLNLDAKMVAKDKILCHKEGRDTESFYHRAKTTRHAGNYDVGAYTLSMNLKIPKVEAEKLLQRFKDGSPHLIMWHNEIDQQLKKDRTLITPLGRKRKFFDRYGPELLKQGLAYIPQETAAHILNLGLINVYNKLCREYKSIEVLLNVHDSILLQHPPELTLFVHDQLKKLMAIPVNIKGRICTIPIDIKCGINWRDLK